MIWKVPVSESLLHSQFCSAAFHFQRHFSPISRPPFIFAELALHLLIDDVLIELLSVGFLSRDDFPLHSANRMSAAC